MKKDEEMIRRFGSLIETAKTVNNRSTEQLALLLGVTSRTINNYKAEPDKIPAGKLLLLLKLSGMRMKLEWEE